MAGMRRLIETIDIVRKRLNPSLAITGVILTRYDSRRTLNREVLASITEHFPGVVFDRTIRENISLAEAPGHGQDIFEYNIKSNGAEDYAALADEMIAREERT